MIRSLVLVALLAVASAKPTYFNEYKRMPGHKVRNHILSPLPSTYVSDSQVPQDFSWGDVNGTSLLIRSYNQHIPYYCGSCWAHGALTSLSDRIKIARRGVGADIGLSVQHILNCAGDVAGSCHGGSHTGTYEFIKENGYVVYDTCLQYAACSSESDEGNCKSSDWSCSAMNICRTCSTFTEMGGKCVGLEYFPNATVAEYGEVSGEANMMKEIYARGPIACGVNASPLHDYFGGIYDQQDESGINHIVSITGWGVDKATNKKYWIVRNSWGEYWGEMGFFRIERGNNMLSIEEDCAWATPGTFTVNNFPCGEEGMHCVKSQEYIDPSVIPMWHME